MFILNHNCRVDSSRNTRKLTHLADFTGCFPQFRRPARTSPDVCLHIRQFQHGTKPVISRHETQSAAMRQRDALCNRKAKPGAITAARAVTSRKGPQELLCLGRIKPCASVAHLYAEASSHGVSGQTDRALPMPQRIAQQIADRPRNGQAPKRRMQRGIGFHFGFPRRIAIARHDFQEFRNIAVRYPLIGKPSREIEKLFEHRLYAIDLTRSGCLDFSIAAAHHFQT